MANKRPPVEFAELDNKPRGRGAILRTREEIETEEGLSEQTSAPNQGNNNSGNQENLNTGIMENRKGALRASYSKSTFRLSPQALKALNDIRHTLRWDYNSKTNLEEIVEQAILEVYQDLMENKESSLLVKKFSGNKESKNS